MSFAPQATFFGIDAMGASLDAFQLAENVTSDNIANVNTPGASRQQVEFVQGVPISESPDYAAHSAGTVGEGVSVQTVQRIHSDSYDALFRGASASQNYYSVEQTQLDALQSELGGTSSGISTQYSALQTAVNELVSQTGSSDATSSSANVLAQAQSLATALNGAASSIQQQEASVLQQGDAIVSTVNGLLDQIASLNGQIRASTAVGDSPNTLEDERDQDIDQLSQYVSTQTSIQPDGSTLVTVNGQALVNDTVAYHLAAPVVGTASNGAPAFKINFATTPPASASTPGIPLGSGQLAALQDLYNNKLTLYGQQLDGFAQSLATEVNRITESGYDADGEAGAALFVPIVSDMSISAANITVGITSPGQLPTALASTDAGSLVTALNADDDTVDSAAQIDGNATLANAPAAALTGTLTVTVNGVAQTFAYNTGAGGNADTIDDFVSSFNAANLGVTASFDSTSQTIVFARAPTNVDAYTRAKQSANADSPDFTISDNNYDAATPATSLLGALGAGAINGVDQNGSNALGTGDNGVANALLGLFNANVGVPPLQTTSTDAAVAGVPTTVALPVGSSTIAVGDVLTIDAQPGDGAPQENVTVTAVSFDPATGAESVTFTPANAHAAGYTISSAQTQTLGTYYGQFVTNLGLDAQTAATGTTTQTSLATTIDDERQSISGINIDEETQNLIKYQSAYSAAARTLNVLDQMVQTIINSLGVGT